MADIELVIKILEEVKHKVYAYGLSLCPSDKEQLIHAIMNGTPLPKGHGDLKDADKLKDAFIKWSMAVQGFFTDSDIASIVYNSPTIIEEDKTESEDEE